MSLAGLDELDLSWTLRNSLTINNDVEVLGDLNSSGFIFDGGLPIVVTPTNNVWTGNNSFPNFQPTFLAPVANEDMATYDYMDTAFIGLGNSYLPLDNNWTGINSMTNLPTISNAATVGTNEAINLSVLNTYLPTTGILGANNTWTGENDFTNKVIVPTPLTDLEFGNKKYVDDAITAFNATESTVYQEVLTQNGSVPITCDPANFTCMTICIVGAGGNGAVGGAVPTGANVKSFGGAGGYTAFQIPAYTGVATLEVATIQADWSYFVLNGTPIAGASIGDDGDVTASGQGGSNFLGGGLLSAQRISGSEEPFQNPVSNDAITFSYNVGVLNGYGQGGSFRWDTGTRVNPTGFYALFIKFRKT
jgi:hypothetical protein